MNMPALRRLSILGMGVSALFTSFACSSSDTGATGGSTSTSSTSSSSSGTGGNGVGGDATTSSSTSSGTGGSSNEAKSRGYYFAVDAVANAWTVTVVDPTTAKPTVTTIKVDDLAAITGPAGNDKGPGWGDTIASPDGKRVFANASNADRTLVIETATQSIETLLKVGGKPLHIYNPNDNKEIWAHNDNDGSFSVINTDTLAVSAPVVAALKSTGHGKLV
jgi:hypothetical protein